MTPSAARAASTESDLMSVQKLGQLHVVRVAAPACDESKVLAAANVLSRHPVSFCDVERHGATPHARDGIKAPG
jgi:hypothetical protein